MFSIIILSFSLRNITLKTENHLLSPLSFITRRIRLLSLEESLGRVFLENQGKAFSWDEIRSKFPHLSPDTLRDTLARLDTEGKIAKIEFNSNKPELNLYILPHKFIPQNFQEEVQGVLSSWGLYHVAEVDLATFKHDFDVIADPFRGRLLTLYNLYLRKLKEYFGENLIDWDSRPISRGDFQKGFYEHMFRELLIIYGDELEAVLSKATLIFMHDLVDRIKKEPHLDIRETLASSLKEVRARKESRREYPRDSRLLEDLKDILGRIKGVTAYLNQDIPDLLGFVVFGSWTRARVSLDADIDILTVSEKGLNQRNYLEIAGELSRALSDKVNRLDMLQSAGFELKLSDPSTFREAFIFNTGTGLFMNNYIVLARDAATLSRIKEMITRVKSSSP